MLRGRRRAEPVQARRPHRPGQAARAPRAWPGSGSRGRGGAGPTVRRPASTRPSTGSCPTPSASGLLAATGAGGRRPDPGGGRRVPAGLHRPRPPAGRPRGTAGQRGTVPVPVGGGLPHVRRGRRRRATRWPPTTRSPCPTPTTSTVSSPTRPRCGPRPTTWSSTGGSWARAASGSTAPTSRAGCSPCSGIGEEEAAVPLRVPARRLPLRRPAPRRLRRRASTGWWPSSPARTASARSSPSRRPSRDRTR